MYFVTMKRPGYCLFAVSPSERFALAVADDQQRVHVLEQQEGAGYAVRRDWPVAECSHTDAMRRLGAVAEPTSLVEFVRVARGE